MDFKRSWFSYDFTISNETISLSGVFKNGKDGHTDKNLKLSRLFQVLKVFQ